MIQYNHVREVSISKYYDRIVNPHGGKTTALEVPEAWLIDSLKVGDFFEKKVGFARCSDEENYNKKVGRELATSRMKSRRLVIYSIEVGEKATQIILIDKDDNKYVLCKKENKVMFLECTKWN